MAEPAESVPHLAGAGLVVHGGRDGAPVHTRFRRAGAGLPVVLIHGVGMAGEAWEPQIAALRTRFDVIAIDMLGHGGSSLPATDARLSDYADQVIAVLDALGLPAAAVIGHSMGALVALETALAYPARVLGVAALNAVFCRTQEQRDAVLARADALAAENAQAQAASRTASHDAAIARWFGEPVPASLDAAAAQVRRLLAAGDPVGYARTYRLFATSDDAHGERLSSLAVPALFLTAEDDPNSTPAMSAAMAAIAPQGRCEVIAGARHMMNLTAPDEVTGRLVRFLDGLSGASGERAAALIAAFDTRAFRQALGSFLTGVTVVTTRQADGEPRGFTANSFSSVSLDPPLVLVCLARTASSFETFTAAGHFAVSVLSAVQRDVSALFASKQPDKFAQSRWHEGPAGSPVIDGAAAWFDCRRHSIVEAGDHVILIGEVAGFGASAAAPLGYCRGAYVDLALSQEVVAARDEPAKVGAILERNGAVLLVENAGGLFDLPTGSRLEPQDNPRSLRAALDRLGAPARLDFLFAVFETPNAGHGAVSIYYRGVLEGEPAAGCGARLVTFDAIPWSRLPDEAVRSMLGRYVRERSEDAFGLYVGDTERGTIHPVGRMR
ncbi:alpha/beta fold hydrolase [Ancylobacter sp. 6x-1]|uniref:Alpha/beta fold hydrolase n=1 Tax=Ancylobacter crimeensis TaxID=2579147 RepID=A0ABT0DDY8_9HYPH|nr:alpha/beta fold hydrolase [Ancylobacter crimeensis]MCK0198157.1 alpha/beta fold hydrolase [Ancylobacter crimeensis]